MENNKGLMMKRYLYAAVLCCAFVSNVNGAEQNDTISYDKYKATLTMFDADSAMLSDAEHMYKRKPKKLPTNTYVPTSATIDKSKSVGDIHFNSGVSTIGAKTYEIPFELPKGAADFRPEISFSYNSMRGDSYLGTGWCMSGLPAISRTQQTIYYDRQVKAISNSINDAFMLDGMRLIKISATATEIIYQSEQGNIKAKGHISGDIVCYFEVFYPDGNKGIFGYESNTTNYLEYPLTKLMDLKGNVINYSYTSNGYGKYLISGIVYNGIYLYFKYIKRNTSLTKYNTGLPAHEELLLDNVICKYGASDLWEYNLSYTTNLNGSVLLDRIDYTANGESLNPLKFYYGNGDEASSFTQTKTLLSHGYNFENPTYVKVVQGKFDYKNEGLIVYPNRLPYYKYYKHSTALRHSKCYFKNLYDEDSEICLYAGLSDPIVDPFPDLKTGKGFIDIFCADLKGQQEEYIVKVNNYVYNDKDHLIFNVYGPYALSGIAKYYSRTFDLNSVLVDHDDNKSIHPKFYYPGDYDGDGKIEVFAVSAHGAVSSDVVSKCYIFDLENNKMPFANHVFPYSVEFAGNTTDATEAAHNSDILLTFDLDGDGKTDICHLNSNGIDFYTFEVGNSVWSVKKIASSSALNRSKVQDCQILLGDYNGDGLVDLLVSPVENSQEVQWTVYYSKGNGQFESKNFNGPKFTDDVYSRFLTQDINGDGKADLVYSFAGVYLRVYFATNDTFKSNYFETHTQQKGMILVPVDINSHNSFTQLAGLYNGTVTKYSFSRDDNLSAMLTGMVSSYGVIEKNEYRNMDDNSTSSFYTFGDDAVFPFVNIQEPLPLLASTSTFLNGTQIEQNSYNYSNAVIHRQGLGFRGFASFSTKNKKEQITEQTFDPYNYSVQTKEVSPTYERQFSYDFEIDRDKIAKILLKSKYEKDLLKDFTVSTSYSYDLYGYPITESSVFSDGITIVKNKTYQHNRDLTELYFLGNLSDETVVTSRRNSVYRESRHIPAGNMRFPNMVVLSKDGNSISETSADYDAKGNILYTNERAFTGNRLKKSWSYDGYSRIKSETDPNGLVTEYNYDNQGRKRMMTDPRRGITRYEYDGLGRDTLTIYPDGTQKHVIYSWVTDVTEAVYSVKTAEAGKPSEINYYDAFDRIVRTSEVRFDGSEKKTDSRYDTYGNLIKVSLPFKGTEASLWNTYSYDVYDRLISLVHASGKTKSVSYSGNKVFTTDENIATSKSYDSQGNLISASDPGGTITFSLAGDGQPESVSAPGGITTSFTYDKYRRRTSLNDASHGVISYEYDNSGNVSKETNANGKSIVKQYDSYNRLIKTTTPEFETSYTYDAYGEILKSESSNGSSKNFQYDSYGRMSSVVEMAPDSVWLRKDYSYADGNIKSVRYTTKSNLDVLEEYFYANGHIIERTANGKSFFLLKSENEFGLVTCLQTGSITRAYFYDNYGYPERRLAGGNGQTYSATSYAFDYDTSNLLWRKNLMRNYTEAFEYDNLNRLTSYGGYTAEYDTKGNVLSKSDVGTFSYEISGKPYAISGADFIESDHVGVNQRIHYTSFSRPDTIMEGDHTAFFDYNEAYERVVMRCKEKEDDRVDRYYLGGCYEYEKNYLLLSVKRKPLYPNLELIRYTTVERLYLGGDYYNAPVVYYRGGIQKAGPGCYNILRDYLGSITHVIDTAGVVKQHVEYDPWGRIFNPDSLVVYQKDKEPELYLRRGYCGHEHLPEFGLINMNARLYDPLVGRFLSPDPYVQMPDMTQNFNRYSYALDNPLKYNDPNGEFFLFTILSAIFDTGNNLIRHGFNVSQYRWKKTINSFKLDMGMFRGGFMQILNKWTYGIVNSFAGLVTAQSCNLIGLVDNVTYMDGMAAVSGVTGNKDSAFTIGHYSMGPKNYTADWRDHLFVHEYGHYVQSQRWSILYFPVIAIPSIITASLSSNHRAKWHERNASRLGAEHFDRHYGPGKVEGDTFNMTCFRNGYNTPYVNPRTRSRYQARYPIKKYDWVKY